MIRTFEAYSKFKKEKFISEPLKVGDEFVFQYSNGKGLVKVKEMSERRRFKNDVEKYNL